MKKAERLKPKAVPKASLREKAKAESGKTKAVPKASLREKANAKSYSPNISLPENLDNGNKN